MVGVQMRKQHMHIVGIGIALQRAQYAAPKIDDQWRSIRRGDQVSRGWRIRPDDAAGATEYGDSHTH